MGFKLEIVNPDGPDFPALMVAFRNSFLNPDQALWRLYTADLEPEDEIKSKEVLEEITQRFAEWHRHDPTSVWMQVIDEETGKIASGARWSVYKKDGGNPYDDFPSHEADWFPDGPLGTVASRFLDGFLASAVRNSNFPHIFLNIIFTVPEYRRQGAASLIMDWGDAQAREHDLGMYLEASQYGRPMYLKYGFEVVEENALSIASLGDAQRLVDNSPGLRKEVEKQLLPITWTSMLKKSKNMK